MEKLLTITSSFAVFLTVIMFTVSIEAQRPDEQNQPDTTIDAKAKTEVIDTLVKDLTADYVFPDMGQKMAATLEDHRKHGQYNSITSAKEFAEVLTKQMYAIAHDKHLRIIYNAEVLQPERERRDEPQDSARRHNPHMVNVQAQMNYAFEEVKRLDGNIGYLKFNAFTDPVDGGPTVAGAMAFLANTDAMIIDLRGSRGGNPAMVQLIASYFFSGEKPVHLNDLKWRNEGKEDYRLVQWWVLPYVPGQRYVGKEVYILTSHRAFSGAEEFCYDMQSQKRATLVGETTGGGANPGSGMRIGDHFSVFMPEGYAVNPITKTSWEGVGVKPDIETPVQNALQVAQKTALEHLIAKTTDGQESEALKRTLARVGTESESGQQE